MVASRKCADRKYSLKPKGGRPCSSRSSLCASAPTTLCPIQQTRKSVSNVIERPLFCQNEFLDSDTLPHRPALSRRLYPDSRKHQLPDLPSPYASGLVFRKPITLSPGLKMPRFFKSSTR